MLTIEQVANTFGVSEITIWRWRQNGSFPEPTEKVGRRFYWDEEIVNAWRRKYPGTEKIMQIDDREIAELREEKDARWTSTAAEALAGDEGKIAPEAVGRQMRSSLGLSTDATDLQVLGTVLDLLQRHGRLKSVTTNFSKILHKLLGQLETELR